MKQTKLLLAIIFLFSSLFNAQEVNPDVVSRILQSSNIDLANEQFQVEENNQEDEEESEDLAIELQKSSSEVNPSPVYGINFLTSAVSSLDATSDLPVPSDYVISLKDTLRIVLSGNRQRTYNLDVGLDGTIAFPELGTISVVGESFSEVKNKLRNLVKISYVGVDLDLSISSLRAKKINIVGAVKRPGSYLVNPFATISTALAYSGGLADYASLRNIKLIRGKKTIIYDLYDFLIHADDSKNLNIQQGDTILVEKTDNFINLVGRVTRPFIYEFTDDETVGDIIMYGLGLKPTANSEKISIKHYREDGKEITTSEIDFGSDFKLANFSNIFEIEVFNLNSDVSLDIRVKGPVINEGYFDAKKYSNLKELIPDLKFTNTVNPFIAVVQIGRNSRIFSLGDPSTHDIELNYNADVIFFKQQENVEDESILTSQSLQLISDYRLGIQYKNETISFPIYGEFYITDIIEFLGLDLSDAEKDKTTFISSVNGLSKVGSYLDQKTVIEKFSSLSFRFKNYETLSVAVEGEVNLPGRYFINPDTTLEQLYEMVGGLKNTADKNVAIFKREAVRQQSIAAAQRARAQLNEFVLVNLQEGKSVSPDIIDLMSTDFNEEQLGRISGDFSINSPISKTFLLSAGDSLFIPKRLNSVAIVGEVLNPTTILFNGDYRLRDYINNAGGYKQYALKNSMYVIKADGTIQKTSGFFIFKRVPKIEPGDTVVIPRDINIKDDDFRDLIVPLTSILSNLAFASAALNQLENN